MLGKLLVLFKIPELRKKIVLTLGLLAIYRMGFWIALPFVNQAQLSETLVDLQSQQGGIGQVMQVISLFSASNIGQSTIFGLGIMPYISASIIFQLMGTVYPPLERLQKEGEAGRKKINEYTRYATVVICLVQSFFWIRTLAGGFGSGTSLILDGYQGLYFQIVATITMTTGTVFLMWIGEQIDAYGIGNGISLLIMAGILARMPQAGWSLIEPAFEKGIALGTDTGIDRLLILALVFVFVVVWVIAITQGQRRIPIQSAKHVRGRRVSGGQRQSLPLRVNQAGVMPIIFASSLLMFPYFLFHGLSQYFSTSAFWAMLDEAFQPMSRGFVYTMSYVVLIYFFCYFWTAITFNPKDMAENLKDYGSFIPGYRPGARTAAYLEQVMVRITYVGAAFLSLVAIIPTLVSTWLGVDFLVASFYGGTGLLIVVSVVLDLVNKIDSHLVMRNYSGLLESDL
ncbi:preprotein translocase subunit SecY [Gimesia maris]|jgi:preprotein translocase subunit SecY|uniref:Protein translocase subunit SecY n=1 Tax=Gimesia maris TaxID=122 RepID=A0ABX5YVD1_9PLAN|nr:preprotein translocase subunit SecY [Gimesia maris]MAC54443.1 preprotein translocase subunit SecY [Gimesia sp.]EDL56152.1 protein translocase subunit SecY [Gimesia maris DSM 8797]QDT81892.1 Protein translocase subunit SecY [Gimesia maris]QDU17645.1 Protein translocase subunit SecY [Gimesia maris]QEG19671.1 Protein translocase subunit SecY [Gimesia maris]|tara:strand:- start:93471 stop:94835 length:1365 start_codon:yes stop_codon:yes gene_type:complete